MRRRHAELGRARPAHEPAGTCVRRPRRRRRRPRHDRAAELDRLLRGRDRRLEARRHPAAGVGEAARARAGGDRRARRTRGSSSASRRSGSRTGRCVPIGFEPDADARRRAAPRRRRRRTGRRPTSGGSTGRPKIILAATPGEFDLENVGFFMPERSVVRDPGGAVPQRSVLALDRSRWSAATTSCSFPRFVPEDVLAAITEHRPTYLYLVPTMMNRIWKLPEEVRAAADMSSLRIAVHMAAPCPPWLKEEWIHWVGPDVLCELYGGTEVQSVTWITGREWLEHRGSVGRPIAGQMKVVGDDGQDLPAGRDRRDLHARRGRARLDVPLPRRRGEAARRHRVGEHRRPGLDGRGRLRVPRRPPQGPDPARRCQRLPGRGRGCARRAPGGAQLRRDRHRRTTTSASGSTRSSTRPTVSTRPSCGRT